MRFPIVYVFGFIFPFIIAIIGLIFNFYVGMLLLIVNLVPICIVALHSVQINTQLKQGKNFYTMEITTVGKYKTSKMKYIPLTVLNGVIFILFGLYQFRFIGFEMKLPFYIAFLPLMISLFGILFISEAIRLKVRQKEKIISKDTPQPPIHKVLNEGEKILITTKDKQKGNVSQGACVFFTLIYLCLFGLVSLIPLVGIIGMFILLPFLFLIGRSSDIYFITNKRIIDFLDPNTFIQTFYDEISYMRVYWKKDQVKRILVLEENETNLSYDGKERDYHYLHFEGDYGQTLYFQNFVDKSLGKKVFKLILQHAPLKQHRNLKDIYYRES